MNKDLKITLGLIVVTAVAYHLWKMSQAKTAVVDTNPKPQPAAPEVMPTPSSNFASYVNMTNDVKGGGFFQSEKVKLNY